MFAAAKKKFQTHVNSYRSCYSTKVNSGKFDKASALRAIKSHKTQSFCIKSPEDPTQHVYIILPNFSPTCPVRTGVPLPLQSVYCISVAAVSEEDQRPQCRSRSRPST